MEELHENRNSPTLLKHDVRELRTQAHQHHKIFDEYSDSEKELIKDFLIKQHDNCTNSFRQQLYYEDLKDFGFKVKRKVVGTGVCGDKLCRIVRVYD